MTGFRHHHYFYLFLAVLVLAYFLVAVLTGGEQTGMPLLIAFDIAALVYLLIVIPRFVRMSTTQLRQLANHSIQSRKLLILVGSVVVGVTMVALATELADLQPTSVAFSVITLLLAWIFTNILFLFNYVQTYYTQTDGADAGGLVFPGNDSHPDAGDFAYFAFTMAIIFSVSDVAITGRHMRRIVLMHGLLAFTFNIFAIGITVGLISGLYE